MRWRWQYLAAIAVTVLNIDLVAVPLLKNIGLNAWCLFFVAAPLATLELAFWYWFWNWFRKTAVPEAVKEKVAESKYLQEGVHLGTKIKEKLSEGGFLMQLRDYFLRAFTRATSENSKIVKRIRGGGYIAMLLLGIDPYPGGRTIGVIFCGIARWRKGFYVLAAGNIVHIAYLVGIWTFIFSFFKN